MIIVIQAILPEIRHIQVRPAVIIKVTDGYAKSPAIVGDTGFRGDVGKSAVVIVVIEAVLPIIADKNVGPAVVVIVADGHAESPAVVGNAGFGGYIGKGAVVIIVEERRVRRRDLTVERVDG